MKPMTKAILRAIKIVAAYVGSIIGGVSLVIGTVWGFLNYPIATWIITAIEVFSFFIWVVAKEQLPKVIEEIEEAKRVQKRKEEQALKLIDPRYKSKYIDPYA